MTDEERRLGDQHVAKVLRDIAGELEAGRWKADGVISREYAFPGGDHDKAPTHERLTISIKGVRELDPP